MIRGLFVEDRFFNWSPHDQRTDFSITATRAGEPVPEAEIEARYSIHGHMDWHAAGNIKKTIEVAESRLPVAERWDVRLDYRLNLGRPQVWRVHSGANAAGAGGRR